MNLCNARRQRVRRNCLVLYQLGARQIGYWREWSQPSMVAATRRGAETRLTRPYDVLGLTPTSGNTGWRLKPRLQGLRPAKPACAG
jgi:hypothetical protein